MTAEKTAVEDCGRRDVRMETRELVARARERSGKGVARKLRQSGRLPGVCYGAQGTTSLSVEAREFQRLRREGGENVILELKFEGDAQAARTVLIKALQFDPLTWSPLHVDFLEIDLQREIEVMVSVVLDGTPAGVARGNVLLHHLREVEVRCLPGNIPEALHLDVSSLETGQILHVRDLPAPVGIAIVTGEDEPLVSLMAELVKAPEAAEAAAEAPTEEGAAAAGEEAAPRPGGRG